MRTKTWIASMATVAAGLTSTYLLLPDPTVAITGHVRLSDGTPVEGITLVACWTDRDADGDYDLADYAVNQNEEPLCWRHNWMWFSGPGVAWNPEEVR